MAVSGVYAIDGPVRLSAPTNVPAASPVFATETESVAGESAGTCSGASTVTSNDVGSRFSAPTTAPARSSLPPGQASVADELPSGLGSSNATQPVSPSVAKYRLPYGCSESPSPIRSRGSYSSPPAVSVRSAGARSSATVTSTRRNCASRPP